MRRTRAALMALAALVSALGIGAVATGSTSLTGADQVKQASTVLNNVTVKGRAPLTGYTRDQFGPAWLDVDNNRCDTRNDVLAVQLTNVVKEGRCTVVSGTLIDPYSGATIPFNRGVCVARQVSGCSGSVQIDHVVPLANAWQTGAQQLSLAQREAFANDPLNLQATSGPLNAAKSDGDAATWLPPAQSYRCTYAARIVAVKARYKLWFTPAERDAIANILGGCT